MRHRVKKIKFRSGKDANKMLLRKLIRNFISKGRLETTLKKAKVLKSTIERFVEKTKKETEANKNFLLRNLNNKKLVLSVFNDIGKPLKDKVGGYVRVVRLGARYSDGAEMARLEWVYPVVTEKTANVKVSPAKREEKLKK